MSIVPNFFMAKSTSAYISSLLATSQATPTTFDPLCLNFKILGTIFLEFVAMNRLWCFSSTSCWRSIIVHLIDFGLSLLGSHPQNRNDM